MRPALFVPVVLVGCLAMAVVSVRDTAAAQTTRPQSASSDASVKGERSTAETNDGDLDACFASVPSSVPPSADEDNVMRFRVFGYLDCMVNYVDRTLVAGGGEGTGSKGTVTIPAKDFERLRAIAGEIHDYTARIGR